jgi:hypothetical protein
VRRTIRMSERMKDKGPVMRHQRKMMQRFSDDQVNTIYREHKISRSSP